MIPPKGTFLLAVGSVCFGLNKKKRNSHWKFFSFESFRSLIRKVYRVREEISINSIKRFRNWFREEASIGEDFILNPHPRLLDQLRCVASVNQLIFVRNNGLSSDATYLNIFLKITSPPLPHASTWCNLEGWQPSAGLLASNSVLCCLSGQTSWAHEGTRKDWEKCFW